MTVISRFLFYIVCDIHYVTHRPYRSPCAKWANFRELLWCMAWATTIWPYVSYRDNSAYVEHREQLIKKSWSFWLTLPHFTELCTCRARCRCRSARSRRSAVPSVTTREVHLCCVGRTRRRSDVIGDSPEGRDAETRGRLWSSEEAVGAGRGRWRVDGGCWCHSLSDVWSRAKFDCCTFTLHRPTCDRCYTRDTWLGIPCLDTTGSPDTPDSSC